MAKAFGYVLIVALFRKNLLPINEAVFHNTNLLFKQENLFHKQS